MEIDVGKQLQIGRRRYAVRRQSRLSVVFSRGLGQSDAAKQLPHTKLSLTRPFRGQIVIRATKHLLLILCLDFWLSSVQKIRLTSVPAPSLFRSLKSSHCPINLLHSIELFAAEIAPTRQNANSFSLGSPSGRLLLSNISIRQTRLCSPR